jgi:hypothetical protein
MPSKSKKQHYFMEAVANNPAFARKADVPQSVGREFVAADKGHKFSKGGDVKKKMTMPMGAGAPMRKPMPPAMPPAMPPGGGMAPPAAPPMGMKKGGSVKQSSGSASSRADGIAQKGKTKGTQVRMAGGGKC